MKCCTFCRKDGNYSVHKSNGICRNAYFHNAFSINVFLLNLLYMYLALHVFATHLQGDDSLEFEDIWKCVENI